MSKRYKGKNCYVFSTFCSVLSVEYRINIYYNECKLLHEVFAKLCIWPPEGYIFRLKGLETRRSLAKTSWRRSLSLVPLQSFTERKCPWSGIYILPASRSCSSTNNNEACIYCTIFLLYWQAFSQKSLFFVFNFTHYIKMIQLLSAIALYINNCAMLW